MGGGYGYCLGYFDHGVLRPTRNLNRDYFAILADAPSDRPDHQSANHDGLGQNVLFEDLHIEFCSTTRPGDGRDDIYTNDHNDVAPGLHRDDSVLASSGTAPVVYYQSAVTEMPYVSAGPWAAIRRRPDFAPRSRCPPRCTRARK